MRTSPTQEQLQGAFALLRVVLTVLDETGGNVTMTNVPILGGTTADIRVERKTEGRRSWWSIELDLRNGDPWSASGHTPQEAARDIWWDLCRESEVFAE